MTIVFFYTHEALFYDLTNANRMDIEDRYIAWVESNVDEAEYNWVNKTGDVIAGYAPGSGWLSGLQFTHNDDAMAFKLRFGL